VEPVYSGHPRDQYFWPRIDRSPVGPVFVATIDMWLLKADCFVQDWYNWAKQ